MSIDRLIDSLAADLRPVRRRRGWVDAAILGAACGLELVLFLWLGPMRPDMAMAMDQPSFWWKSCALGLIAAVGSVIAILSFNPVRSPRSGLRWLLALVAVCLMVGWGIDAARDGFPVVAGRLDWRAGLTCVTKMVVLSVPAVIALGFLMRRGAASDPGGSALTAGIAAAAWGAFVFVFACPFDDPLYIAVWYAVGCGIVTGFARLVLPTLTRW